MCRFDALFEEGKGVEPSGCYTWHGFQDRSLPNAALPSRRGC